MSVGKASNHTKCGSGGRCGCSASECITLSPRGQRDHLLIPGGVFQSKNQTEENSFNLMYNMSDYYCGSNLGRESTENRPGDRNGVFTQASGPVQIR